MQASTLPALAASLLLAASTVTAQTVTAETEATTGSHLETATFSMYCYWTGEATLGRVDGVVASRIGHWGGAEIVQVDFDPEKTHVGELSQALKKQRSFYALISPDATQKRAASDYLEPGDIDTRSGKPRFIEPKHSLRTRNPQLLQLDLSEQQAIALNSWSYFGGAMPDVLTAEQKQRLGN
ncbi:MAG: hypothetical protein AAF657_22760 [Acidobacteriota bacterium]